MPKKNHLVAGPDRTKRVREARARAWAKVGKVPSTKKIASSTYTLETVAASKAAAKRDANRLRLISRSRAKSGYGSVFNSVRVVYAKPAKVWAVYGQETHPRIPSLGKRAK